MVCLLGFLLKWGHDGSQHRIVEKTMQKHLCKWGVFRFMPRDQHLCMTIHSSEREERVFFEATPVKESFKINTKKLHRKVTKVTMIYHLHSCREIKDYRFLFDRCGTCKQGALHFMTFLESACHLWYWIIKWSIIVLRTAIALDSAVCDCDYFYGDCKERLRLAACRNFRWQMWLSKQTSKRHCSD